MGLTPARLQAAMERTWSPHARIPCGAWLLRDGRGGGKRVSAARPAAPGAAETIPEAEAAMKALGQEPLFVLTPEDAALDAALDALGYRIVDPVLCLAAPAAALAAHDPKGFAAIRAGHPLARMREIWAEGGIGPARLAVMARSGDRRCHLLGRAEDRAAGVAYVATDGDLAMVHAVEVLPAFRRRGVARALLGAAASFAAEAGAATLALAVTEANAPARALYESLGMAEAGRYHYRARGELQS